MKAPPGIRNDPLKRAHCGGGWSAAGVREYYARAENTHAARGALQWGKRRR